MTASVLVTYVLPLLGAALGYLVRHKDLLNIHGPDVAPATPAAPAVPVTPAPAPITPAPATGHPILDRLLGRVSAAGEAAIERVLDNLLAGAAQAGGQSPAPVTVPAAK